MNEAAFPDTEFMLDDDRRGATIRIGNERVHVGPKELENFIFHLGQLRESVLPEVPRTSPENRQFLQVGGPAVEIIDSDGGTVVRMAFRTPGYGWIGFQLKPEQAVEVGRHIVERYGPRVEPASGPEATTH